MMGRRLEIGSLRSEARDQMSDFRLLTSNLSSPIPSLHPAPHCIIGRMILNVFLGIAQVILAIGLIAAVLIQSKGEELGGVFGGGQSVYQTRRGVDKLLFTITVLMAIVFFGLAVVNVVLSAPQ